MDRRDIARLRQAWRDAVLPSAEAHLAGTALTFAWAAAEVDAADTLQIRIPALTPISKDERPSLTAVIRNAYGQTCPGVDVTVQYTAPKLPPRRTRRVATEWDVWQPGDPDPGMHEALAAELRAEVLSPHEPAIAAVLSKATATAFSQDQVWLSFPKETTRQAVGRTYGAGALLHNTLATWQGGYKALLYVDAPPKS